jgi:hypothetical protein
MLVLLETNGARHACRASLALAVFLAATGCGRHSVASTAITVEFETTPRPPRTGPVTMALRLSDSRARPVSGAHIELEGNMTHAGMAPVFSHASELQPGRYQSRMELTMPGDWVVLLHAKLASGEQVEKQFEIRGVRPQ